MTLRKKYYILANSILYERPTEIVVEDFTDSDLDDDDIIYALSDTCLEFEQHQYNTIIIPEDEINSICTILLSKDEVCKER